MLDHLLGLGHGDGAHEHLPSLLLRTHPLRLHRRRSEALRLHLRRGRLDERALISLHRFLRLARDAREFHVVVGEHDALRRELGRLAQVAVGLLRAEVAELRLAVGLLERRARRLRLEGVLDQRPLHRLAARCAVPLGLDLELRHAQQHALCRLVVVVGGLERAHDVGDVGLPSVGEEVAVRTECVHGVEVARGAWRIEEVQREYLFHLASGRVTQLGRLALERVHARHVLARRLQRTAVLFVERLCLFEREPEAELLVEREQRVHVRQPRAHRLLVEGQLLEQLAHALPVGLAERLRRLPELVEASPLLHRLVECDLAIVAIEHVAARHCVLELPPRQVRHLPRKTRHLEEEGNGVVLHELPVGVHSRVECHLHRASRPGRDGALVEEVAVEGHVADDFTLHLTRNHQNLLGRVWRDEFVHEAHQPHRRLLFVPVALEVVLDLLARGRADLPARAVDVLRAHQEVAHLVLVEFEVEHQRLDARPARVAQLACLVEDEGGVGEEVRHELEIGTVLVQQRLHVRARRARVLGHVVEELLDGGGLHNFLHHAHLDVPLPLQCADRSGLLVARAGHVPAHLVAGGEAERRLKPLPLEDLRDGRLEGHLIGQHEQRRIDVPLAEGEDLVAVFARAVPLARAHQLVHRAQVLLPQPPRRLQLVAAHLQGRDQRAGARLGLGLLEARLERCEQLLVDQDGAAEQRVDQEGVFAE
mmetsp:Transcript_16013/g.40831  ORF Transcript_16013/g.40831 Transcript_16013/m.40831 type:complete len:708 (+) Transcript_16013:280-2403(+)